MANLPEVDQFDSGIYQWETTDQALGGVNGVMNAPPKSFANRTRFLLNRILDGVLTFIGDSGAKNAITLVYPQPVPALKDGMEINFRVAVTNDGAVNVSLTNTGGNPLPTLPLYGGDHAALAGGELPGGAGVRARLNTALNVANGGAWVIMAVSGGYARVPTAPTGDMSTKVANMAALFQAFNGLKAVDVSAAGDTSLTAAQYGVGMLKLTGALPASKNLLFPAQTGQWIIDNEATGNYNITAVVAGGVGTGVVLPVGSPVIVQSDGANIKFASAGGQAGFRSIPVSGIAGTSYAITGGYTPGSVMIEKNGSMLEPGTAASPDFTATDGKTINFTQALVASDSLTIYLFSTFNVANAVQKSGDTMGGPLALYAGSTASNLPQNDNSQNVPNSAWVHPLAAHGQCRLSVSSAAALILKPYNGQCLNIGGTVQQIPQAGVSLSNASLAASTLYYVYAYMAGATMTLEAVATTHATGTNGVEQKSGDATRTLVGMIYTNASGQFVDSGASLTLLNWFNRRDKSANSSTIAASSTNGAAMAELSTSLRVPFLCWADEAIDLKLYGVVQNTVAGGQCIHSPSLDGAATSSTSFTPYAAGVVGTAIVGAIATIAEGYHLASGFGEVSTGQGNWVVVTQVKTRG